MTLFGTPCGRVGTASRLGSAFHDPLFRGVIHAHPVALRFDAVS
jgi:hypothetical protein